MEMGCRRVFSIVSQRIPLSDLMEIGRCFPKVASAQLPCQPRLIPNSDIVLWTGPVTSTKAGC